jgi:hypothetical protein
VNIDHIRELDDLFEHRNDALVLLCLAYGVADAGGRPLHFREWARALIKHTGTYISENAITRSLPRLKERRLVVAFQEGTRHPAYRPSRLGAQKAALLALILDAIENHHNEAQDDAAGSDDDKEALDEDGEI